MAFKLEYGIVTDRGKKREINEDSFTVLSKDRIFIVADGMGGHYGGEIASNLAIEILKNKMKKKELILDEMKPEENIKKMDLIINHTNDEIRKKAKDSSVYNDMGTTVVGGIFFENSVMFFHIGDSRGYLLREDELIQVSYDHSWVNEQLRYNRLSTKEAKTHKWKNVIMRALGGQNNVIAEYSQIDITSGDKFIICSDGLSDMVSDRGIARIAKKYDDPQTTANVLLREALKKGGLDNITIIVIKVV